MYRIKTVRIGKNEKEIITKLNSYSLRILGIEYSDNEDNIHVLFMESDDYINDLEDRKIIYFTEDEDIYISQKDYLVIGLVKVKHVIETSQYGRLVNLQKRLYFISRSEF